MYLNELFNIADGGSIFSFDLEHGIEKRAFSESALVPRLGKSVTEHIRTLLNKSGEYNERIGTHPDFLEMSEGEEVNQYVISVFVDIQGSTNLAFKYDLSKVRMIKNRILSIAIEIFQGCDGHVHRLQGDAIFGYFGDRASTISNAVINALNACSILQAYINEHLKIQFEQEGIEPIKLRVGLDLGYDKDVLWSKYGIRDCSETTTTSLHTDLAAKLQGKCSANKIMIGQNILTHLDIPEEFISIKKKQVDGEIKSDRYIVNRNELRYKMFQFEWEKYIRTFSFVPKNDIFSNIELQCKYGEDSNNLEDYIANSKSIKKGIDLKFSILGLDNFEDYDIEWSVINRGIEASNSESGLEFEVERYRGVLYCLETTAYKGHHYMQCTIRHNNIIVGRDKFGIYVNDN
ncbi:hypothetical protein QBE53_13050 [Vallitaleaceae bacterium 9-2]